MFQGTTSAICFGVQSLNLDSMSAPNTFSGTLDATDITFNPVTITAGLSSASPASSISVSTTATATNTNSGTSTSAKPRSTNVAVQGSPAFGPGVLGALGVAVAGVIL